MTSLLRQTMDDHLLHPNLILEKVADNFGGGVLCDIMAYMLDFGLKQVSSNFNHAIHFQTNTPRKGTNLLSLH